MVVTNDCHRPVMHEMELACGLRGGVDEDVQTAVPARFADKATHEGSKVSLAVGVGARPQMYLDWLELVTQAGTPMTLLNRWLLTHYPTKFSKRRY